VTKKIDSTSHFLKVQHDLTNPWDPLLTFFQPLQNTRKNLVLGTPIWTQWFFDYLIDCGVPS
jgi:hypothetical protein